MNETENTPKPARYRLYEGQVLEGLAKIPDGKIQCCVTSPPYFGLRDYGVDGQIGLEQTPDEYVAKLVEVFREVRRVLRDDGTLWLNIGDSYVSKPTGSLGTFTGEKHGFGSSHAHQKAALERPDKSGFGLLEKNLIGIPWRVAFALQADGWYLRQDIIWHKPNAMPESVRDRCTKSHEYVFLLSKSQKYFYDNEAVKEPLAEASIGRAQRKQRLMDRTGLGTAGKQVTNGVNQKHGYAGLALGRNGKTGCDLESGLRNRRSVWSISTKPCKEAHFATMPLDLAEVCVLAGSKSASVVLDPFGGSGTTAEAAIRHGRKAVLCELNPEYCQIARKRLDSIPYTAETDKGT